MAMLKFCGVSVVSSVFCKSVHFSRFVTVTPGSVKYCKA